MAKKVVGRQDRVRQDLVRTEFWPDTMVQYKIGQNRTRWKDMTRRDWTRQDRAPLG